MGILPHIPKSLMILLFFLSVGVLDPSSSSSVIHEETQEEKRHKELLASTPPISSILNLHDFESIARRVLPPKAWAYYSSAADDEITLRENRGAYLRYVGLISHIWYNVYFILILFHIAFGSDLRFSLT